MASLKTNGIQEMGNHKAWLLGCQLLLSAYKYLYSNDLRTLVLKYSVACLDTSACSLIEASILMRRKIKLLRLLLLRMAVNGYDRSP